MVEYPSNSDKARRPETVEKPQVQRVTRSEAIVRKKGLGRRFSETFMGGDARTVGSYVTFDVLLPALRDMVADTVTMGIERMVYGEASRPRSRGIRSNPSLVGHTPYNRMSAGLRPDPREQLSRRARATHDFGEIVLPTRIEATEVIDGLFNLIQKYEQATVANLYDLLGMTPAYTDGKWGWTEETFLGADIRHVRGGYLLKLPQPEAL
jgi:hypothetical protein